MPILKKVLLYQVQTVGPPPKYFYPLPFLPQLSEPNPRAAPRLPDAEQQAYAGRIYPYFYPLPWLPQLSEPNPRRAPTLPEPEQQAYAGKIYPYFYPLPFIPQLSEPNPHLAARLPEPEQQAYANRPTFPYFNSIGWFAPLSEPVVKTPPRLLEDNQQAYPSAPNFPIFLPMPWFMPLSEPVVKAPLRLQEANQIACVYPPGLPYRYPLLWFEGLAEPVRFAARLPEALHLAVANLLAQPPPPVVSIQWFSPLSEPIVKVTPRLPESEQQAYAARPPQLIPPSLPWLPWQQPMRIKPTRKYGTGNPAKSIVVAPPPSPVWYRDLVSLPVVKPYLGEHFSVAIVLPSVNFSTLSPPWKYIQGKTNTATNVTSTSATFNAAVSSPDVVIGVVSWNTSGGTITLSGVTDDKGNNYIIGDNIIDNANNRAAASFVLGNISNTPQTITATFSASTTLIAIEIDEYSGGFLANDPRDGNTAQLQSSPGNGFDFITSGTITTSVPGDLIWGATNATNGTAIPVSGYLFNLRDTNTVNTVLATEDQTQSQIGTYAATFTNSTNQPSITFVMAIKPFRATLAWFSPLSEPVREGRLSRPHYHLDLAWSGPNPQQAPTNQLPWFSPLSEPVRYVPRLGEHQQMAWTGNPAPTYLNLLPWLPQLPEPIVKTKPRLLEDLQQSHATQAPIINYSISPWQLIQGATASNASTASLSATFTASVSATNLVVGLVSWSTVGGGIVLNSVTDDKGNNYFIANNIIDASNNQATTSFIFGNILNGPSTITAAFSATTAAVMIITEYSGGIALNDPRNSNVGQFQAAPSTGIDGLTSGNVITTQNGDLIWGGNDNTTGANLLPSAGSNFNLRQAINDLNGVIAVEDRKQNIAGPVAATFTRSVSYAGSTFIIAIRPAVTVQATFQPLSEPVVKTPPRLSETLQQTFATVAPPIYFAALPWFVPLSEPVRFVSRLRTESESMWAAPTPPQPPTKLPWFVPLSEPVRFRPRLGAQSNLDLAFIAPEVPTIRVKLQAVESGDVGNLSSIGYSTPLAATIGIHETR